MPGENRSHSELSVTRLIPAVFVCFLGEVRCASPATMHDAYCSPAQRSVSPTTGTSGDTPMKLGNFSVSLAVKDIAVSRTFYEKLGFKMTNGDGKSWIVLMNGISTIGLFQGLFERNMLTFNPGWDSSKATLPDFA